MAGVGGEAGGAGERRRLKTYRLGAGGGRDFAHQTEWGSLRVMAQPKTIFDDVDEAIEEASIADANAQVDAGEGIPHEVVGEWLKKLARGEPAPPTFLDD